VIYKLSGQEMLSKEWLTAFAPIGAIQGPGQWRAFGACVFFIKHPLVWTITAGHVVDDIGANAISILCTKVDGGVTILEIGKIHASAGISWVRDPVNDLAAAPTPLLPGSPLAIKAVSEKQCLPFKDLLPAMPCFTIGCPYGLHGVDKQRSTPLVLDGVVSGMDHERKRIYTSAPTFPGNSGGPLIVFRSPFTNPGFMIGPPVIYLAGIMLETRLIFSQDPKKPMPPLHLGFAVSTDAIISLLDSEAAKAIITRLKPTSK
jgi:hypothetical protein